MIVMCHKPTQINNTCRPSADTIYIYIYIYIYITTHNNAAFFDNLKSTFKANHNFNTVFESFICRSSRDFIYKI